MQVPLQFEFLCNETFESYFPGNNAEIVSELQALSSGLKEQQIYLWGNPGCGKSHLLQACCHQAKILNKNPFYLSFPKQKLPSTAILDGLEQVELVCLDDLQNIGENQEWQQELFNFYNRHRENNHQLLLAADCPPKYLAFQLIDLKTRMGWGLTLKIKSLQEDQLMLAVAHKAHYLGFDLPAAVGRFLLNHYAHDLPSLWLLLGKIDRATLAAKRKLTIPFLKQILADKI